MTKWLLAAGILMPLTALRLHRIRKPCTTAFVLPAAGQLPTDPKPVVGKPETRGKQGMKTLVQHVTQGFKAMPPRGLCMDCSVEDYRNDHRVMNE